MHGILMQTFNTHMQCTHTINAFNIHKQHGIHLYDNKLWYIVRAILVKPPLSNMWTSGGQNKLLNNYAGAIGNEIIDGDEMAALELREEIISHLRYLDMAVYNNVFNPIATEGENGATKELVRSYYEDPVNEYKSSKSAIDQLIDLAH